jgi:hypothetical protein
MIFGEFDPLTVSREDGGTGRFVFADENIATFQYTPSEFSVDNWGHSAIPFMPLIKIFGIPVSESPELSALESRIEELEGLLADVSRLIDPNTGYDTVRFESVNVQIVNGSGTTDGETTGTGNLIIGYNELRETPGEPVDCSDRWAACDYRGGSHMLVIGEGNNYTSDSHGGMVVGSWNETSAPFASISGGNANTASGHHSSVSGGGWGTASGEYASVSGGSQNRASGVAASASGGNTNTASGVLATVSGGLGNKASGANSSVSGGDHRTAPGDDDWAAGGLFQDW